MRKHIPPESSVTPARAARWWDMFKTCRSRQSRPVFGNLRRGGPYSANTENSRAVFSPSEILRGLLGAARERPPLVRPPPPLAWCLAPRSGCAPPSSPAAAGRAHKPRRGRGEATTRGFGDLPAAQSLLLSARRLEGASVIIFCYSDRGWLFPFTRYRPPRDIHEP